MSFRPKVQLRSWWIYPCLSHVASLIPIVSSFILIHFDWCFCRAILLDSGGIFPDFSTSTISHPVARHEALGPPMPPRSVMNWHDSWRITRSWKLQETRWRTAIGRHLRLEQVVVIWGNPQLLNLLNYINIYIHINIIDGYWWILILLMDMNIYIYIYEWGI